MVLADYLDPSAPIGRVPTGVLANNILVLLLRDFMSTDAELAGDPHIMRRDFRGKASDWVVNITVCIGQSHRVLTRRNANKKHPD